jgi:large subunit ribosomal protein L13
MMIDVMPQSSYFHTKKQAENSRKLHRIDAQGRVLGRMATEIAVLLRGRHKPTYTAFIDCGDHVVVSNASKFRVTGNKAEQKFYFSHSGYAGGAKVTPFSRQFEKDPRKIVYMAVKRMIRDNRLRGRQLARLKIYVGAEPSQGKAAGSKA